MKSAQFLFSSKMEADPSADMLSIYVQSDVFTALQNMTQAYGRFKLENTSTGFLFQAGEHRFVVEDHLNLFRISVLEATELNAETADLLATVGYFLFHNRYSQCELEAITIREEAQLWHSATAVGLNITTNSILQGKRFTAYTQAHKQRLQQQTLAPFHFTQEMEATLQRNAPIHTPQKLPNLFAPTAAKTEQLKRYRASIFMDSYVFTYLKELVRSYGNLAFWNTGNGFELALDDNRITISAHQDLYRLSLITGDSLKLGAAELLAKATYHLFYDKYGVCRLAERNGNKQALWDAAIDAGIEVSPANDQQKAEFQRFAQQRAESFRQTHQNMLAQILRKTQDSGPAPDPS